MFLVILALNLKSVRAGNAGISRFLNRSSAILGVSVAVVIFGVYNWPVASKGLGELTAKERDAFVAELRTQSEPILVHLMCPPNDERDCTVATQFIGIFERVGWHVKGKIVDRVFNATPKAGFYFVLHSTVDPDPGNPEGKTGAWTKTPRAYFTVKNAFDALIRTDIVVGAGYPQDELGLYFGVGTAKP